MKKHRILFGTLLLLFAVVTGVAQTQEPNPSAIKKWYLHSVKATALDTLFLWHNPKNNSRKRYKSFEVLNKDTKQYNHLIKDNYYSDTLNIQIIYFTHNDSLRYVKQLEKYITKHDTLTWSCDYYFKADTLITLKSHGHRYWNTEELTDTELTKKILLAYKKVRQE